MDSLVLLCAHRVVAQRHLCTLRSLHALPPDLYPFLFQAAFPDGRALVLQDLVATWPFPVLNLQRLLGRRDLLPGHTCIKCFEAVIQGMVVQLQQVPEQSGPQSRRCRLRFLDLTGLSDSVVSHTPDGLTFCSRTQGLAEACVEVSKHQQEFQRRGSKQHKGCSGATMAEAALQHPGVDVHTDLVVNKTSYGILRNALQTGAANPLRLKCHKFQTKDISASDIMTLLESLDPCCLQRVELCNLGLTGLWVILPHLSRFPELRSLKLWNNTRDWQLPTPESAVRIHCLPGQLGMLPSLRELNLASAWLSGNLRQILCNLQAPLESLVLLYSFLLPADLTFLSQSIHVPALQRLVLSGHDISQGLLEPLRLLLEKTSASLLHLDLMDCHMADSHLAALLPTLLRCSRLRFLGLHGNSLCTAVLKDLLQKTLELPDLHVVVYPVPQDCYLPAPLGSNWVFPPDQELLEAFKAEISQLLADSGRTDLVWTTNPICNETLDYFFF